LGFSGVQRERFFILKFPDTFPSESEVKDSNTFNSGIETSTVFPEIFELNSALNNT
jgi:hypothetical protein